MLTRIVYFGKEGNLRFSASTLPQDWLFATWIILPIQTQVMYTNIIMHLLSKSLFWSPRIHQELWGRLQVKQSNSSIKYWNQTQLEMTGTTVHPTYSRQTFKNNQSRHTPKTFSRFLTSRGRTSMNVMYWTQGLHVTSSLSVQQLVRLPI